MRASGDGLGIALKVEDGAWRALGPGAGGVPRRSRMRASPSSPLQPSENSRGELVGEIVANPLECDENRFRAAKKRC